jgi:Fic-DOC domain mobile mystery protein B
MQLDFNSDLPQGATPLDKNEAQGLKLKHIVLLSELNEFENQNIATAMLWLPSQRKKELLNITFLLALHKKMFGDVWKWAGTFRTSDKNIGVPWFEVPEKVKILLEDVSFWIENGSYSWEEIGVRLHHRLVSIHPFPNGNGRHARLFCDAVFQKHGIPLFAWGNIGSAPLDFRTKYIAALRAADRKDYAPLLALVARVPNSPR